MEEACGVLCKIRVFYAKVATAIQEGYNQFKDYQFTNKNGFLYSFTGLRGDAKRMYKSIMKGQEKRVKLIKAPNPIDQENYIKEADMVIWACGY